MPIALRKQQIPWLMAGVRALLGPTMILGEACRWNGIALTVLVITALVSDIFDGVLARRWQCDTPGVRLFDTIADTIFYLGAGVALFVGQPHTFLANAPLLCSVVALEAAHFAFDFTKFGKPASYHSYLAKTWGLVLATSIVTAFATGHGGVLLTIALALGIVCKLEGLAMSIILPVWHKDVTTLAAAWKLRGETPAHSRRPNLRKAVITGLLFGLTLPAFAVDQDHVEYVSGTSNAVKAGTVGNLDLTSPTALLFKGPQSAQEISIPYAAITHFDYRQDVARHMGFLPALFVGLIKARERKHLFTISYTDDAGAIQVVVFEVPKRDPRLLLPVLRERTKVCDIKQRQFCGGSLEQHPFF